MFGAFCLFNIYNLSNMILFVRTWATLLYKKYNKSRVNMFIMLELNQLSWL